MGIWGTGADGSVVISTNTTLTGEMNYSSLTVNNGVYLDASGYTIYCTGTLTNNGIIKSTGGAGGAGGSGATGSTGAGGAGGSGSAGTGNGGTGGGGGGAGGGCYNAGYQVSGGTGGQGGNGGIGGSDLIIWANNLINNNTIQSNGENGSDAGASTQGTYQAFFIQAPTKQPPVWYDWAGGGGGGGAGGDGGSAGNVDLHYSSRAIGTVTATGGSGGALSAGSAGIANSYAPPGTGWNTGGGSGGATGGGSGGASEGSSGSSGAGTTGAVGVAGSDGSILWTQESGEGNPVFFMSDF